VASPLTTRVLGLLGLRPHRIVVVKDVPLQNGTGTPPHA